MQSPRATPTAIAGALGLILLGAFSGCGRSNQGSQAAASSNAAAAAAAAASSAEASASDAQGSAALARARVPAAGTVANAAGENQKTPPPSVNVAEEHEGGRRGASGPAQQGRRGQGGRPGAGQTASVTDERAPHGEP